MSEIVVVGVVTVHPGTESEAEEIMRRVVEQTHAEDGCVTYALHRGLDEPNRLVLVERWRSRADLDAHFVKPYMAELVARFPDFVPADAPPVIVFAEPIPAGTTAKGTLAGGTGG